MKKLLIGVSLLLALPLFGAYESYLKIEGVKGGSKDPKHLDWVEVSSFSRGIGRANAAIEQATFTVPDLRLLPQFAALVARGTSLMSVVADVGPARYTMSHVLVSSTTPGGSAHGGTTPTFSVTLNFSHIEMTTIPQDPARHPADRVTASMVNTSIAPPNAELLIDNRVADRFSLIGLQRRGNNAVLQLRDASGYFRTAAGKTRSPKVTVQAKYLTVTMNDCLISSYAPNPDGTATVTLNFAQYSGPASFRH